jgi:DNA excision repair protein ERCC-5
MGVQNLWQILDPTSKPIRVETLQGKKLAVDASIWLHQFVKAMRDAKGDTIHGAHLVGFLRRVCKLLFYGIKPVFIFDGGVPELKKRTIHQRKQRRSEAGESAQKTAEKLFKAQLKLQGIDALESGQMNSVRNPAPLSVIPDEYELPAQRYIASNENIRYHYH